MSMIGEYLRVTAAELDRTIQNPQWALDLAEEIQDAEDVSKPTPAETRHFSTYKTWDLLRFLLSRAGFPVDVIHGEEPFTEEEWGYGAPKYLRAERVRLAAEALRTTSYDQLIAGADPRNSPAPRCTPSAGTNPSPLHGPALGTTDSPGSSRRPPIPTTRCSSGSTDSRCQTSRPQLRSRSDRTPAGPTRRGAAPGVPAPEDRPDRAWPHAHSPSSKHSGTPPSICGGANQLKLECPGAHCLPSVREAEAFRGRLGRRPG